MNKANEANKPTEVHDVVTPDEVIDAPDSADNGPDATATDDTATEDTSTDATTGAPRRAAASSSRSASASRPRPSSSTRSGSSGGVGARPNPYADWSVAELQYGMKYLDDQERRFAFVVGPLVAVLDVVLTVIALHRHVPHFIHGHVNKAWVNPGETLALGVASAVIACLVVVCAYFRRRSLTLFALLFSGYGGGLLTMLPAWVLAGWLFVHFSRMQKVLRQLTGGRPTAGRTATGRSGGRVPTKPGEAVRAGAASARERGAARRERGRKQTVPTGPAVSKRYTPPKPTRPRPPSPS